MFVKICGITNEQDALLAVAMGADAVGFVFAPSPRQVMPSAVAQITPRLPPHVLTVGVFVDELPQRVAQIVNQAGLRAAQLHGHESPEDTAAVGQAVGYVIKALRAPGAPGALAEDARRYAADALLIDGASPGSGQLFDWALVHDLPRAPRVILAGGLTPDNVADAIRTVRPWGVDVSTGVESTPGKKDPAKMRAFMKAARAAEPEPYAPSLDGPYDWQSELR